MTFELYSDLVQQFARGNGTVFVGAGASIPAGLPSWSGLLAPLKRQISDCPDDVSAEDIAHLYAMEHGSHRLVEYLQRELSGPRFRPTRVHRELVQLPIPRIFTTNFDNLLEQAAWDARIKYHVVVNEADVSFNDTSTLQIVKLHGDLAHPESLVIATPEYESFFRRRPALSDLVKVELQTRTVLFLGYSFNDENLRQILSRIGNESCTFQRNLYSIQLNPKPLVVRALEHRGVKTISVSTDSKLLDAEKEIETWLRDFSSRVFMIERRRQKGFSVQSDQEVANHPKGDDHVALGSSFSQSIPPQPVGVPHEQVFDRILQCLGSRYPVVVLTGDGGFGKTHLAITVAWACLHPSRLRERRHGVEYVAWVPFGERQTTPRGLSAVLDAVARATGSYGLLRERNPERRHRDAMRLLLRYRCLVVLDNYNGTDLALNKWLEEVPEPSRALITTRRPSKINGLMIEVPGLIGEEARRLLEQRTYDLRLFFGPRREAVFEGICKATAGNPQAMRLFLGLLKCSDGDQLEGCQRADDVVKEFVANISNNTSPVEALFEEFWENRLSKEARRLLRAAAVLSDISSSFRPEMLYASLKFSEKVNWAHVRRVCLDTGLLERRPNEERYIMRPQIRAFIFDKPICHDEADEDQTVSDKPICPGDVGKGQSIYDDHDGVLRPLLKYVRPLVERVVSRDSPPKDEEYWNALVTDAMLELDPDILLVMAVARWAVRRSKDSSTAVPLVLMLTHYLDSRFMHKERIEMVLRAVKLLRSERKKNKSAEPKALRRESLFLIDALGWTYLDQGGYDKALKEIDAGERLLPADRSYADLRLIASAWRAEAHAAKGDRQDSQKLLEDARQQPGTAELFNDKPWIAMRFEMACGDVDLLRRAGDACAHYKKAREYAAGYGDEGHGYQWRPRLALAYILENEIDEARKEFHELINQTEVELARLHGRYGLALLAATSSQEDEPRAKAGRIRVEIERRAGASSLLLRLFDRVFEDSNLRT